MRQFCEYHVEAVSREADHLAITALTRALQTPLRIAYLDQSSLPQLAAAGDDAEAEVNFLEFEEEAAKRGEKGVEGALLYRASLFRVPLSHERCLLVQAAADWRVTQVPDTTTCCTGEVRRAASGEGGPEDCRGRRTSPGEIVARSYKGRCVDNPALSTRTSGLRGKRRIVRERGGWLRVEKAPPAPWTLPVPQAPEVLALYSVKSPRARERSSSSKHSERARTLPSLARTSCARPRRVSTASFQRRESSTHVTERAAIRCGVPERSSTNDKRREGKGVSISMMSGVLQRPAPRPAPLSESPSRASPSPCGPTASRAPSSPRPPRPRRSPRPRPVRPPRSARRGSAGRS